MRLLIGTIAGVLLLVQSGGVTDTRALLAKPKQRIRTADYRATGHLVRVDANGTRTNDTVAFRVRWFPGVLRVLLAVTSPPAARANILFEMHPDGQDSIQWAHPGDKAPAALPFDKWSDGPLGPGFSYEDFLEPQYFWPGQTSLGATKYGARECDMIKSTPGATNHTHYSEVRSWLDHGIGFPVYVEKKLKQTAAVKEYTYFGLRQDGGVWSASQVEAKIRGQGGSTLLIIERGSTKANLDVKDFSPAQLLHF